VGSIRSTQPPSDCSRVRGRSRVGCRCDIGVLGVAYRVRTVDGRCGSVQRVRAPSTGRDVPRRVHRTGDQGVGSLLQGHAGGHPDAGDRDGRIDPGAAVVGRDLYLLSGNRIQDAGVVAAGDVHDGVVRDEVGVAAARVHGEQGDRIDRCHRGGAVIHKTAGSLRRRVSGGVGDIGGHADDALGQRLDSGRRDGRAKSARTDRGRVVRPVQVDRNGLAIFNATGGATDCEVRVVLDAIDVATGDRADGECRRLGVDNQGASRVARGHREVRIIPLCILDRCAWREFERGDIKICRVVTVGSGIGEAHDVAGVTDKCCRLAVAERQPGVGSGPRDVLAEGDKQCHRFTGFQGAVIAAVGECCYRRRRDVEQRSAARRDEVVVTVEQEILDVRDRVDAVGRAAAVVDHRVGGAAQGEGVVGPISGEGRSIPGRAVAAAVNGAATGTAFEDVIEGGTGNCLRVYADWIDVDLRGAAVEAVAGGNLSGQEFAGVENADTDLFETIVGKDVAGDADAVRIIHGQTNIVVRVSVAGDAGIGARVEVGTGCPAAECAVGHLQVGRIADGSDDATRAVAVDGAATLKHRVGDRDVVGLNEHAGEFAGHGRTVDDLHPVESHAVDEDMQTASQDRLWGTRAAVSNAVIGTRNGDSLVDGDRPGVRTAGNPNRVPACCRVDGRLDGREAAVADQQDAAAGMQNELDVAEGIGALGSPGRDCPAAADVGGNGGRSQGRRVDDGVDAVVAVDGIVATAADEGVSTGGAGERVGTAQTLRLGEQA